MKRLLPTAIVAACGLLGVAMGHWFGESRQPTALPPVAAPTPNQAPKPAPTQAPENPEDNSAVAAAQTLIHCFTHFPTQPGIFNAIDKLNLAQVRKLHSRMKETPPSDFRREILRTSAERWIALDPAHGADYARKFSAGVTVSDNTGLLAAWARHSPEDALAEAEKYPGSAKAASLRKEALGTLATRDPAGTLVRIETVPDEAERTQLLSKCLTAWAAIDSALAARWIVEHGDRFAVGTEGNEAVCDGLRVVASSDVHAAIDAARKLGGPLGKAALSSTLYEWGWQDAGAALEWCHAQGVGLDEQRSLVGTGMMRGPEKIVARLRDSPAGEDRDALIATALTSANVEQAEKLFPLLSGSAQVQSTQTFINALAKGRTGAGWSFATAQPEGELRARSLYFLLAGSGEIVGEERVAALPPGKSRDSAYAGLVERTANASAEAAVGKIRFIGDPKMREQMASRVFVRWRQDDRAAAERWLAQTTDISAPTKEKLNR